MTFTITRRDIRRLYPGLLEEVEERVDPEAMEEWLAELAKPRQLSCRMEQCGDGKIAMIVTSKRAPEGAAHQEGSLT